MADMSGMIYKLQKALLKKGVKIYISTSQFYSEEQDRYIKMYRVLDGSKNEIINTASQIKVVNAINGIWQGVKDS